MNRIKYDSDSMSLMALFESLTGAKVKDCIVNEKVIFIIEENEMGKAIGKSGANIKMVEGKLKKKVKLVEFSSDLLQFVKNMAYPAGVADVTHDGGIVTIRGKDTSSKAMLIGRERQSISHLSDIVKRYFSVREIKVV